MRSSLVLAAFGISVLACNAAESKSASSDWQCTPTPVHDGETVTCTTSAKITPPPREVSSNQPPSGGTLTVRTYGVPADTSGSNTGTDTGSGDSTAPTGSDEGPISVADQTSNASPPDAPAPDEYDCSAGMTGGSCPPAGAIPSAPAPAPAPATGGGTSSGSAPSGADTGTTNGDVYAGATDYRCKSGDNGTTCTRKTIECAAGTMQVGGECLAPGEAPTPSGSTNTGSTTTNGGTTTGSTTTSSTSSGGCTLTQGYWKTHASKWPTQVLTIGGVAYSESELLDILNTAPTGDASLILAHQLIAAMLNAAAGADTSQVGSAIQAAQTWMSANKDADGRLPYGVAATSSAGAAAVSISSTLDTYNNGGLNIPHCN